MYGTEVASASAYTSMRLRCDNGPITAGATGPAMVSLSLTINPTLIIVTIRGKTRKFEVEVFFPNKKGTRGAILDVGNGDLSLPEAAMGPSKAFPALGSKLPQVPPFPT